MKLIEKLLEIIFKYPSFFFSKTVTSSDTDVALYSTLIEMRERYLKIVCTVSLSIYQLYSSDIGKLYEC